MNKRYTKKQITEAIAYWKKQLNKINESQYDSTVKINVYDVEFADFGTTTDVAAKKYSNVQFEVNLARSIVDQIEKWFDLNVGVIPLSYKFKTVDTVKCKDYDKLLAMDD